MSVSVHSEAVTRRQLLRGAAGLAALGGGAGLAASLLERTSAPKPTLPASESGLTDPVRAFHSRPDLRPPAIAVSGRSTGAGALFLGPTGVGTGDLSQAGPLLIDHRGGLVFFQPLAAGKWAANVRVQSFNGERVLTWWEGTVGNGYGQGEAVIMTDSYHEVARVSAAGGRQMDLHEFVLTPQGTALFTCYPQTVRTDLSAIGGARDAAVLESAFQEVDVRTGRLVSEWNSLDHIPPEESYLEVGDPYDYLHMNSIALDGDGNLLVSGRETWTIYKLDRRTGAVIWRLGGKRTDFVMGKNARFAWQHHATPIGGGAISLFDDGSDGHRTEAQSRGVVLAVDERRRTSRLARSYTHPQPISTPAMGSMQVLPNGQVVVGWGSEPYASEFTDDGRLVADMRMPSGIDSYRALRYDWRGAPATQPAIALGHSTSGKTVTLYASWNGATYARFWQVHAGMSERDLRPIGVARHRGFETAIPLGSGGGYVAASALDHGGRRLATSQPIRV
jgi:Arylsulfotransferase (ASST)